MGRPMLHLKQSGYFADERLPLELIRRRPQFPFPLHTHEFSELVIVLSGSGTHFTDTDEYTLAAGDAFVIEGNSAHGYRNVNGLVLVNILFDPVRLNVAETDLREIPGYRALLTLEPRYRRSHGFQSRLRLKGPQLAHAETLVDSLERECREKRAGYHSLAAAYFMQIVGYLARCFTESDVPQSRPILRLADAMSFVEENLARQVRMEELVAISELSESTLLRGFKKAVGLSPMQYHLHLKVERACELLCRPELSITEVSYRSGFSDSNYFSRQFRKSMECTPREYRRKLLGRGSTIGAEPSPSDASGKIDA